VKRRSGKRPILVIDDDEDALEVLSVQLSERWKVMRTTSASAALREIHKRPGYFRVVISDMVMPEMDGVSFFGEVRKVDPRAMRILLTGYPSLETAERAINEGHVYMLLRKPWRHETLCDAVHRASYRYREQNKRV
jgi:DNA-binding NtrC family response regulator